VVRQYAQKRDANLDRLNALPGILVFFFGVVVG
jgi:hypothetical protein